MRWDMVLIALLWACVAVYFVRTLRQVSQEVIEAWKPSSPDAPSVVTNADVPEDLVAIAMNENEVWAQEEVLRVIRERYETYNDWNKVRAAMGLGRRD